LGVGSGVGVGAGVGDGEAVADGVGLGAAVGLGLGEAVGDPTATWLSLGEADGLGDAPIEAAIAPNTTPAPIAMAHTSPRIAGVNAGRRVIARPDARRTRA
jgi:hypothetical protein